MQRIRTISLSCGLLALIVSAAPAHGEQGGQGITGRVSSALRLSLRQGWQPFADQSASGVQVAADASGVNSVQITLSGTGSGASSQIIVPLEMRTNEAYQLRLTLVSFEGVVPEMLASIGSVRPSGTLVASRAAEVFRDTSLMDLGHLASSASMLHGTRISVGGNFTTPGNALLADLNLAISQNVAVPGSWRAVVRISLDKSS